MITAVHTLVYADDAEAARAFFADVLGWPHVDAGDGWLIFKTGPSELGVHPTSESHGGEVWSTDQHHVRPNAASWDAALRASAPVRALAHGGGSWARAEA